MFTKILVGYDDSPGAQRALQTACELAKVENAGLWALAVLEHLPKYAASVGEIEETRSQGEAYLHEALSRAQEAALATGLELHVDQVAGQPAHAIVKYAVEHDIDLLVLGHSGHSGVWGAFLGTTADKTIRHAHCSVLVVR
jgi:nucleotide-binding universal stress UspA family protein